MIADYNREEPMGRISLRKEQRQLLTKLRRESPFEVFYSKRREQTRETVFWNEETDSPLGSGWYYWFCFPGCLPEGEPCGPFTSETAALLDIVDVHCLELMATGQ